MTSTRLASSGFSEGFGWGAQSRGLIKPSLGNCYLTIFLFGTVLVPNRKVTPNQKFGPSKGGVEFHSDTTKRGIKAKTLIFVLVKIG